LNKERILIKGNNQKIKNKDINQNLTHHLKVSMIVMRALVSTVIEQYLYRT